MAAGGHFGFCLGFFKAKTYTIRKSKIILGEQNAHDIVAGSHTIYISVYVGHSFWKAGLIVGRIVNN